MSDKLNQQELREVRILAREGRAWLLKHAMGILTEAEVTHMPPARVQLWIGRLYDGGVGEFRQDHIELLSE